jgi:hypothetical protein
MTGCCAAADPSSPAAIRLIATLPQKEDFNILRQSNLPPAPQPFHYLAVFFSFCR